MLHSYGYKESMQRGTAQFPAELYHLDAMHPRYQMVYHWHLEPEMIRVLQGRFILTCNEEAFALTAGEMVFLSSGTLHGGTAEDGCIYECIVLDQSLLQRKDGTSIAELQQLIVGELAARPISQHDSPALWQSFDRLVEAIGQVTPGSALIAQGRMLECYGHLLNTGACRTIQPTAYRRVNRKYEQIKRVLTRIEHDYAEQLTLDELAAEAGMSAKYFCHFFQQLTHRTPIDYLNDYRIEQACCLLLTGEYSVTETAFRCGFNDLSYFIRIFRKYKGTSPGKYEKMMRAASN